MILHIDSDASYLSEPRTLRRTGGTYYLSSLPTDLKKSPTPPPPANVPIRTEFRILKHVVASAAKAEVGVLFHNGQTAVPLRITLHELGFTQPPNQIKANNSADEGIVTATVRQKRTREMDMPFYWMKDRVKKNNFSFIGNQEAKAWGIISQNIIHHITIGKFVLSICIWQMPYLKSIIIFCKNGPMLCSHQSIRLQSRQSIRLQSRQTVLFCTGVLMLYVRTDKQIPKQ